RAEYRLRLRANNATSRLTPVAMDAGCVGAERREWFTAREEQRARWASALSREVSAVELANAGIPLKRDAGLRALAEWMRFPDVTLETLAPWLDPALDLTDEIASEVAEDAIYAPYLERQESELRDLRASEGVL